jgi:hypothetical protein
VGKVITAFVCVVGLVSLALGGVTVTDKTSFSGGGPSDGFIKVETDNCTYYYHKAAGIMCGMLDKDGKDWIGWSTAGSSAGQWRGLFKPHFDWLWEAQNANGVGVSTTVSEEKTDYAKIASSKGGNQTTWEFYPTYVTMTVVAAAQNYYFTYEGATYGRWSADKSFCVKGDSEDKHYFAKGGAGGGDVGTNEGETWEWAYIGDDDAPRVMFFANHKDDDKNDDIQYSGGWQMGVYGMGRQGATAQYNASTIANDIGKVFSVGFAESTDKTEIAAAVKAAVTGETSAKHGAAVKARVSGLAVEQVKDGLKVKVPFAGSSTVTIHDLTGRALVSRAAVDGAGVISTANLPSGSYIVKATAGDRVATAKISKF